MKRLKMPMPNAVVRACVLVTFAALLVVALGAASALALNPERHYEMVSPVYKGGYGVTATFEPPIAAVAADGESVAFFSPGAFAGAPGGLGAVDYFARRGESGWLTAPLMPPASIQSQGESTDVSASLGVVLQLGFPGSNFENLLPEDEVLLHRTSMPDIPLDWELAGVFQPLTSEPIKALEESATPDFCHLLLDAVESPLVQEAVGVNSINTKEELYQFDRGCGGEPRSLALVGLNNKGNLISRSCYTTLGSKRYSISGVVNEFNAVSTDGGEVFFTTCQKGLKGEAFGSGVPHQVFVRLGGLRTLEVSRPLGNCEREGIPGEVPCDGAAERASADFQGASSDGSRVFFTTAAPLVPGDSDAGSDLYMASIGCPQGKPGCAVREREVTALTQVSKDPTPSQAANVLGVVRVAPDGTRVYFVASGDLLTAAQQAGLEGEARFVPRPGAANLYEYDSATGGLAFIDDLCSGASLSGTVRDVSCPSASGVDEGLWTYASEAQTAGLDGRFLVFASYAQLLEGDTNVVKDVYRYDAVTGRLVRVSSGEAGYDANGNRTALNTNGEAVGASIAAGHYGGLLREQNEMNDHAISEDGSRIVFSSAEPLSPAATNGQVNAYEWQEGPGEGSVSLVSSGNGPDPVGQVVISPSGNDIFFAATEGLVPQDTDGAADIYDARLGAGFPRAPAPAQPCSGDACQGPLMNPAALLVPGSVSQMPGGNFAAPAPVPAATVKVKAKPPKCKRGYVKKKTKCVKKARAKRSNRRGK